LAQKPSLDLKLSGRDDAAMETFLSFLAVATLAVLMPGPDAFVVMRTALAAGRRAGMWAGAGSAVGNLVWGAASVVGVTGLLAASGAAFSAVKLAGAAYLVYLGVQSLRAARRGESLTPEEAGSEPPSAAAAFRRGLASDLLNVKVGLFFTALMPQFMTADAAALLPAAMVSAMGVIVFSLMAAYAHLAARLSSALRRRRSAQAVNGTLGAVLLALGARLAMP
jgi:threonine/homoserine/homoserine lactone efflux protein